jgi:thioredoxin 1
VPNNVLRIIAAVAVLAVFGAVLVFKTRLPGKTEVKTGDVCGPRDAAAEAGSRPAQQVTVAAPRPTLDVKKGLPAVLDFGRGTCAPCKIMKPILDELKKELAGKVEVRIVDTGENPDEADKFKIELIPTQVFLDAGGKEVYRHEGFLPKEDIMAKLKGMGVK